MLEWIELYESGRSLKSIADAFGTYPNSVLRFLKRHDIARRTTSEAASSLPSDKIIQDYKAGQSARQIAGELGSTVTSITDLLKRHGIAVSVPSTRCNWSFLYNDHDLFAYWLGWMLSDGYICYKKAGGRDRGVVVGLTVERKDEHIVCFFRDKINPHATLSSRQNAQQLILSIPRADAEFLGAWGLVERKSLILKPTRNLIEANDRFFYQMLVGYVEGDGSVSQRGGSIVCGSKGWLKFIAKRLKHPKIRSITPHNGSWRLRFGKLALNDLVAALDTLGIKHRLLKRKWDNAAINIPYFFEDELANKPTICEAMIAYHKGASKPAHKLRPQQCQISQITPRQAGRLYDQFHIMGRVGSKFHIGCFWGDQLLAAMSIRRPQRTSVYDWEISRMARHNDYVVYGLWSYVFNWVIRHRLVGGKIVTFSDKRFGDGSVYRAMGFEKDGYVKPDYYWVRDGVRKHKSALRKTPAERETGRTEYELRTGDGYHKVWDLGKTRWCHMAPHVAPHAAIAAQSHEVAYHYQLGVVPHISIIHV